MTARWLAWRMTSHATSSDSAHAGAESAPRPRTDAVEGLTVADVMHANCESLPPSATVGDLREWFAHSASRRLALIAADGRYVGSVGRADVEDDTPPARPVAEVAQIGRTLLPQAPAAEGRDLLRRTAARRVPVVDHDGYLLGVLAMTSDGLFYSCEDS